MQASKAVRAAAAISGKTLAQVSTEAGRTARYAANICSGDKEPTAATIAALLEPCGYALAAVPGEDLPHSALVIDPRPR